MSDRSTRFSLSVAKAAAVWLALAAMACSTPIMGPPPAPAIQRYTVGAPDQLRIHILPEPEIAREVRVRPDGQISIDLIGDVQAAGLTPEEIAEVIQRKIARFKRDAVVSVSVVQSSSGFVTILGEVSAPGTFSLEAVTRVSQAIGRVGGPRPFASLNNVRIIRPSRGVAEILEVRLKDILDGDLSTNFVVEEGDLVVVPPTALARVGYAFQMLLFPLQPLLSGAATVGAASAGVSALSP